MYPEIIKIQIFAINNLSRLVFFDNRIT